MQFKYNRRGTRPKHTTFKEWLGWCRTPTTMVLLPEAPPILYVSRNASQDPSCGEAFLQNDEPIPDSQGPANRPISRYGQTGLVFPVTTHCENLYTDTCLTRWPDLVSIALFKTLIGDRRLNRWAQSAGISNTRIPRPTTASIHDTTPIPRYHDATMFVHWQHSHSPQVQRDARVIANAGQFAKCTRHRLSSSSSSTAGGSIECLCSYLLLLADDFQRGVPPTATRAHIPARVVEHGNQLKAETNDAAQPKPAGGPDRLLRTGCHTSKARLQTHHTSHRHPGLHAPRGSRLSQCQVLASGGEEFPPGLRSQAVGRAKLFVVERRVYSICPFYQPRTHQPIAESSAQNPKHHKCQKAPAE
ncbi:uncharacterized protein CLUP02_01322 [Colletotrichum lupini]|uniref:Uncharacterized protein n=1 Tax=Colletotrichum lupini TaxID=145971 RepID=A0A9Q8SCH5_9PEZI|nr:uncharacterized protein CLUP02_01322 [Colletotrichum lupini]UQC74670.1 hypothetical protein CLUP02_01322 [Colletotrichum lupini]